MTKTYTLIASNGQEAQGIPTWGYIHANPTDNWDFQFENQVHFHDGDSPADAVVRFQEQGILPAGQVTVERGERLDDYWIHEDHQRAYTVTITPNPGGRPKIGNIVSVAMGDTLPRVDAYAEAHDLNRAAAIRELVTQALDKPTENLTWSVVRGESPTANAVEPGIAGVEIPEVIVAWAIQNGLDTDDPDMYLLVTPEDEAGEVDGELAFTTLAASKADADLVRETLSAQEG